MNTDNTMLQSINTEVLPEYKDQASLLVDFLIGILNKTISVEDADQFIASHPELKLVTQALSGKSFSSEGVLLSFGNDSQSGDITINDVANGNIVKINFNITSPIIGTATHNLQLDSEDQYRTVLNWNKKTSFRSFNLFKRNLAELTLSKADFLEASLRECSFLKTNLQNAVFTSADLFGTDFRKAQLQKSALQAANFFSADLGESDLSNVIAENCNFGKALLIYCKAEAANFRCASFYKANVQYSNFSRSILSGADFSDAITYQANFYGTDLTGALITEKQMVQMQRLRHAIMPSGKRYNGFLNLKQDIEDFILQDKAFDIGKRVFFGKLVNMYESGLHLLKKKPKDFAKKLADYYSVSEEEYLQGQKYAYENGYYV